MSETGAHAVELDSVTKAFGEVIAADSIDLAIPRGEFVALLGPSGCGKTTLLRILAGLEAPTRGRVRLGGEDVTGLSPRRRGIGFVFQRYALFPHMSVLDNVAFGLRVRGESASERRGRAAAMLDLVQLTALAERLPSEISGGQAQRVALARALAPNPPVLLLDEPLSALDLSVRVAMQEELRRIHQELGTTFVFVTHDQGEALTMADRIVLMDTGRIVQDAPPFELYRRPTSLFTATFVGDTNAWPCVVRGGDGDRCTVEFGAGAGAAEAIRGDSGAVGDACTYVVRPERLCISAREIEQAAPDSCGAEILVEDVIIRGATALVISSSPIGRVRVQVPVADASEFSAGQRRRCVWSAEDAFVFPSTPTRSEP